MKKKIEMPMSYRFDLGNGKSFRMDLSCPFEQLTKKDRKKLQKNIIVFATALVNRNRIEKLTHYQALLLEIEQLEKEWKFSPSDSAKV